MSVEFEIEYNKAVLAFDAYSTHAIVTLEDLYLNEGTGARYDATRLRQLRRFLEHVYPASEDGEHEPDPWEPAGGQP